MSLDLLDTPVRLTWDLHGPGPPLSEAELLGVAGRIAAAGVFFVTLEERPLAHPALAGILAALAAGGCQVQLVCTGTPTELASLDTLRQPLPGVQLDITAFVAAGQLDAVQLERTLSHLQQLGVEPALRLTPLAGNLGAIPQLLNYCSEHGVRRLKLSNARIGDSFRADPPGQLPRWPTLEAFRVLWGEDTPRVPDSLQLEIHDRFLWEIMTPELEQARSEYGGCQAGNSLGHVDAAGRVYACEAWPQALGSLCDTSLEDIWNSPGRLALREKVATTPAGCLGCRDYALCLGGCRGLGESLNREGEGRDLMCRAPRR